MSRLYPAALHALRRLLDACGETHWRDRLALDLDEWRRSGSVRHHLEAYGAMGSLTDVYLLPREGSRVTPETQPWAQAALDHVRSTCYLAARAQQGVARLLLRGEPDLERSLAPAPHEVLGWRCRACGYAEVTPQDLDRHLAGREVRRAVVAAAAEIVSTDASADAALDALVDAALDGGLARAAEPRRQALAEDARHSGVAVRARASGWMRPCARCAADDTETAAWIVPAAGRPWRPRD